LPTAQARCQINVRNWESFFKIRLYKEILKLFITDKILPTPKAANNFEWWDLFSPAPTEWGSGGASPRKMLIPDVI
jgi:hypothetical protein